MSLEHDLRELVAPALGADVVVDDVTVTPAGRRRVVRVTVDRALDGLGGTERLEVLARLGVALGQLGEPVARVEVEEEPTGRVLEVTPSTLRLQIPAERKTPASEVEIPLPDITRGRVQVEFSRPDADETESPSDQPEQPDESR